MMRSQIPAKSSEKDWCDLLNKSMIIRKSDENSLRTITPVSYTDSISNIENANKINPKITSRSNILKVIPFKMKMITHRNNFWFLRTSLAICSEGLRLKESLSLSIYDLQFPSLLLVVGFWSPVPSWYSSCWMIL